MNIVFVFTVDVLYAHVINVLDRVCSGHSH